jgi:hypothetical protein
MVRVLRLVRDALADHGTVWLNVGDTYSGGGGGSNRSSGNRSSGNGSGGGLVTIGFRGLTFFTGDHGGFGGGCGGFSSRGSLRASV